MDVAARIEASLADAVLLAAATGAPPRLAAAMRHAVFRKGVRTRPRLTLAVAAACGDDRPALACAAAAAIELLHCASLVDDDMPGFHDAETRRGKPSVHRAYGVPLAVLAGDALIVLAFQTLARAALAAPERLGCVLAAVGDGVGVPFEWRELYAALDAVAVAAVLPFYTASIREFRAAGRPVIGSGPVGAEGTAAWMDAQAGVAPAEAEYDRQAATGRAFSLDLAMSHLTADIICRTVFTTTLRTKTAHDVFAAFTEFERSVAQVEIRRLIWDRAWTRAPQRAHVLEACRVIRAHLGALLDTHLAVGLGFDDIAQQVIEARDDLGGKALTREELIDQLGELFLAGDETSARALTRCFAILASHPALVARLRAEVEEVTSGGPIEFHHLKRLTLTRNIFRETLRLYPPITFLPRIANQATSLDGYRLKKGALVMVAPWVLHRHRLYWQEARVLPARGVTCRWQGKTFCHSVGSRHVGRPVRSDDPGRSA